jgi:hypothetical protein
LLAQHTAEVAGDPDDAEVASLVWREAGEVALPHVCSSLAFVFGMADDRTGMSERLKSGLYDAFASQGLALTRPKPQPAPIPAFPSPPVSSNAISA